jgi:hypothetical protein
MRIVNFPWFSSISRVVGDGKWGFFTLFRTLCEEGVDAR